MPTAVQDEARAAQFYQRAADRGSSRGLYLLGGCYEQGRGVEQDLDRAGALYRQAADKGEQEAKQALERVTALKAQSPTKQSKRFKWPFGKK